MTSSLSKRLTYSKAKTSGRHSGIANAQAGRNLQRPTTIEYTHEAAKGFLKILDSVAQQMPVPGISIAVRLALNIIKACEDSYALLENAEELTQDITLLLSAVVNQLKGKKPEEITQNLKEDIQGLQSDLQYIKEKLGNIASQGRLRLALFSTINEEIVLRCRKRLDRLLQRFVVVRHIDHASHIQYLENEIRSFHETLEQMQSMLAKMTLGSGSAVTTTSGRLLVADGPSPHATRAAIPANNDLFYGRDALVTELAIHLTATPDIHHQRHTCVLGPGGMGKTSTALAVMAHPIVKDCYPDQNLVWVPCVQGISISLFFDTLALSLGITDIKGTISNRILLVLRSAGPLILLLDNFETPWNIDGARSVVGQILRDINQITHVTLFITMRSSTPPCRGIRWKSVNLKALNAVAARSVYSDIYPDSSSDPQLAELLELIGHMPLAVTLMATSATLSGLSAKDLIQQYEKLGPTMLDHGSDSENNMDICIGLSIESIPMKQHPEARWLLGALAMLPLGTTFHMLDKWWGRSLSNTLGALQVLQDISLVERRGPVFVVLPVIQRYISDSSRFDADIRSSMIVSACKFLLHHDSGPGHKLYKEHKSALAAEDGNLEAVLLQITAPSNNLIRALLVLARYHNRTRPRRSVIQHALQLILQTGNKSSLYYNRPLPCTSAIQRAPNSASALRMSDDSSLHGHVLVCYGNICHNLDHFEESRKHYISARNVFLSLHNTRMAAWCLLNSSNIYNLVESMTLEGISTVISEARLEFESINDDAGIADCLLKLGIATRHSGDYDAALNLLHRARFRFTQLELFASLTSCSYHMANCYYYLGDLNQAESCANSAQYEYERLGLPRKGMSVAWLLGRIYAAQGQKQAAIEVLIPCLAWFRASGLPSDLGCVSEAMGVAWLRSGEMGYAREALREAFDAYQSLSGGAFNCHRCQYLLRKLDDPNARPIPEENAALVQYYPQQMLDLLGMEEG